MNDEKTLEASSGTAGALTLRLLSRPGWQRLGIGAWLACASLLLLLSFNAYAASEETFVTLKVGDRTYQNVRVTTKGKNFIIISHSAGITSLKVSELPLEILQKLGYAPPPKPRKHIKEGPMWAGVAVPKMDMAPIQPLKAKLSQAWYRTGLGSKIQPLKHSPRLVISAAVTLLAVYLFYCYCCMLICQKTDSNPGLLVFVPLLQAFPMLRAASMSPWWFVGFLIPGVNLVVYVVWSLKIVAARQKTTPLALLLMFPLTSWFAFLFLAFSEAAGQEGDKLSVEIMTPQSVPAG